MQLPQSPTSPRHISILSLCDHTCTDNSLSSRSENTSAAEIQDLCSDQPSWLCVLDAWEIKYSAHYIFAPQIGQENH